MHRSWVKIGIVALIAVVVIAGGIWAMRLLAPGSLDRSSFSVGVEKALVPGSHVPMQLQKDLEPLPAKLESELSQITGGYARYKLGLHVVLVKKADLEIKDILKNVAVKETAR